MTFRELVNEVGTHVVVDGATHEGCAWMLGRHEAELRQYGPHEAMLVLADYGATPCTEPAWARSQYFALDRDQVNLAARAIESHLGQR